MKTRCVGILTALALCVTVGGVYATWTYASGDIESVEKQITLGLEDKVLEGRGEITVEGSVSFLFDQKGKEPGKFDYTADFLLVDTSTDYTVTYKAGKGATNEDYNDGITVVYTLSVEGDSALFFNAGTEEEPEYVSLFKADADFTAEHPITMSGADGEFTGTVTAEELYGLIGGMLNEFVLDTPEKHEAFDEALKGITLTVTFAEKLD